MAKKVMAEMRDTEVRTKLLSVEEEDFGLKTSLLFSDTTKIIKGMKESCQFPVLIHYNDKQIHSKDKYPNRDKKA